MKINQNSNSNKKTNNYEKQKMLKVKKKKANFAEKNGKTRKENVEKVKRKI